MFGAIGWELSLQDTDLSVNSVALDVRSCATDGSDIHWSLHGDGKCLLPTPNTTWKTGDLAGSKRLVLRAVMATFENSSPHSTQLLSALRDNDDEGTTMRIEVKLQGEI